MNNNCCDKIGKCGGCDYRDLSYEQLLLKKQELVRTTLAEIISDDCEFEDIIPSPLIFCYRNKMEFTFGDDKKDGPLRLGMHQKRSFYNIVSAKNCDLISDDIKKAIKITVDYFDKEKIQFFHKKTHIGYLRHLIVRKSFYEDKILINLVTTTQIPSSNIDEVTLLKNYTNEIINNISNVKGIINTKNDSVADCVKNEGEVLLYGEDYLIEEINGLKFKISPFSFFQTNSQCVKKLYDKVKQFATYNNDNIDVIYDLYCGTGTISQYLSDVANKVYGIEIIEEAIEKANENAKMNNINNTEYICYDINKVLDIIDNNLEISDNKKYSIPSPNVIILDPPREGVIEKSLKKIIDYNADRIVYVSCKITSLLNDAKLLIDNNYKLIKICPVDMFPWTKNVETVALFIKK